MIQILVELGIVEMVEIMIMIVEADPEEITMMIKQIFI